MTCIDASKILIPISNKHQNRSHRQVDGSFVHECLVPIHIQAIPRTYCRLHPLEGLSINPVASMQSMGSVDIEPIDINTLELNPNVQSPSERIWRLTSVELYQKGLSKSPGSLFTLIGTTHPTANAYQI